MENEAMNEKINRQLHEARTGKACICPTDCDCENADVGLVSNECPVHNNYPQFTEGCPVHDEGDSVPDYLNSLEAAFQLVEWMRKERSLWASMDNDREKWIVEFYSEEGKQFIKSDESLPRAISLACYAALGIGGEK